MDGNNFFNNYYLPMNDNNYFETEAFSTPNESFTTTISNTMSEVLNTAEISHTISETSNLEIIDETSVVSSSSRSDIWKFFNKEKMEKNKIIAKCKYCKTKNSKYSVINGATTNLWTYFKKVHPALLGILKSQCTLDLYKFNDRISEIIEGRFKNIIEKISKFHVVSADTIKRDIMTKYIEMRTNIKIELHKILEKMAFSLDLWTSSVVKAYMGDITIDKDISFCTNNHFRCFVHVVNLSVQAALKQLKDEIDKIQNLIIKSHSSPQERQKFLEF
ncbi:17984_t:CDS:2 [Gigaspora margarita]|uniref:17984_t:CDS:1 n=1 Tax=Gigaspora margarita TaxID=4874 RepID=A0ABN7UPJ3_GIGMA|nr:17984_t:CDS:2 [Gigaspora margarita]